MTDRNSRVLLECSSLRNDPLECTRKKFRCGKVCQVILLDRDTCTLASFHIFFFSKMHEDMNGTAFELGRHEWLALLCLITTSRIFALSGGFAIRFLWETSQVDGRIKNWTTKRPHPWSIGAQKLSNWWANSRWSTEGSNCMRPSYSLMCPSVVLS